MAALQAREDEFNEAEGDIIWSKGDANSAEVWDDTELIKAYDDAIESWIAKHDNIHKPKDKRKHQQQGGTDPKRHKAQSDTTTKFHAQSTQPEVEIQQKKSNVPKTNAASSSSSSSNTINQNQPPPSVSTAAVLTSTQKPSTTAVGTPSGTATKVQQKTKPQTVHDQTHHMTPSPPPTIANAQLRGRETQQTKGATQARSQTIEGDEMSHTDTHNPPLPPLPPALLESDPTLCNVLVSWYHAGYWLGQYRAEHGM